LKARARRRPKGPRPSPGRGGEVPLEHRKARPAPIPWDARARSRFQALVFLAVFLAEVGIGFNLWISHATELWDLDAENENLADEIAEQKLLADEVREMMDEDKRLRDALTFLDQAERRRRLPALALDRIEVSKPVGLLWIDSIEIRDSDFAVEAFVHEGSRADEIFMDRLEAGPLLNKVKLVSRVATTRPDGPYDRVRVEGEIALPSPLPGLGGGR
jgi:hypothetical protein